MPNHPPAIDSLFRALADPTRRAVIAQLSQGPASVSELAGAYDMALPSFLQHLKVLESSGLVRSSKQGRVRTVVLEPLRLREMEDWLAEQRALWEQRLDQLDAHLQTMQKEEDHD